MTADSEAALAVEFCEWLLEAALAGLIGLGAGDAVGVASLVAVGQRVEPGLCRLVLGQRLRQLRRYVHRARRVVQIDVDVDLVTGRDARAGPVLGTHARDEL